MYLKKWLDKTKTSVVDFAALLKISRGYLHEILNGKKTPSKKILEKIESITMEEYEVENLDEENRNESE